MSQIFRLIKKNIQSKPAWQGRNPECLIADSSKFPSGDPDEKTPYKRENKYEIEYKGIILQHYFSTYFVLFDKTIMGKKHSKE